MGEHPERPDVRGGPDLHSALAHLGPAQFGRCVVRCGEGRRVGVRALWFRGHVEVGRTHRTVVHQQDVGGFEIAVHPAGRVQLEQSLADLAQQYGPLRGPRTCGEQRMEGVGRPLQDEDRGTVRFGMPGVVDGERFVHPDQPW